ncbi:MAG: squalene/phytoene synthase family protein [Chthoniobacteraceae bacterium]
MKDATAEEITRASKSNLALAFVALPPETRRDITVFYAFCRAVDDIADEPGRTAVERRTSLDHWKSRLTARQPDEPGLAVEVRQLIAKYGLPAEHLLELIRGCEMDVDRVAYETWEDLRVYCHRVASVVGLVSIEIFGCRDPQARVYAEQLGLALQLTNIVRDVGQDFRDDRRIYLPRADLAAHGYSAEDLAQERHNDAFTSVMQFEARRARSFYARALAERPESERRTLVAAETMRLIYSRLLDKMERDSFRVFDRRYRLNRWEKAWCVARGRFGW